MKLESRLHSKRELINKGRLESQFIGIDSISICISLRCLSYKQNAFRFLGT